MCRAFQIINAISLIFCVTAFSEKTAGVHNGKSGVLNRALVPGTYVFAKGGLRLRKEADENSDVLALIPNFTRISVSGEDKTSMEFERYVHNGAWVRTKFSGKSGFVNKEFIRSILSSTVNPSGKYALVEVVAFPRKRGEYMLDSDFYLWNENGLKKLPESYRGASPPVWLNDRYAVFSTESGDGAGGINSYHRFDSERNIIEDINGTYYFEDETGQCDRINECICGGTFYTYGKRAYFLETGDQVVEIYFLPEDARADSGKCMHGIFRNKLKRIKTVKSSGLKYDDKYYDGLRFTDGKKKYTIQNEVVTID